MEIIQLLIILFSLFAFSRAVLRARDGKLSRREFIMWSTVWIAALLIGFLPNLTSLFAKLFGIGRGMDFVIYMGILLLFYLLFRLYVSVEKTNQNVTQIVRGIVKKK